MNIQEFIKAKESEFDEKYLSYIQEISIGQYDENGVNIGFLPSEKVIKNFLSQSLLEYNEKIKEMIESNKKSYKETHFCRFNDGECNCDCYLEALDDIITNLTTKDNE